MGVRGINISIPLTPNPSPAEGEGNLSYRKNAFITWMF